MSKLRVGLLFGGRSVEHEVSLVSASSIHHALDPARYEVTLIAVDREGRWRLGSPELPPEATLRGEVVNLPAAPGEHTLVSGGPGPLEPADELRREADLRHEQQALSTGSNLFGNEAHVDLRLPAARNAVQ